MTEAQRLAFALLGDNRVALLELSFEHRKCQGILQHPLHRTLERSRTEHRIVTGIGKLAPRAVTEYERELAVGKQLAQVAKLQVDDVIDLAAPKRMEHHDVVHAIEEFRLERAAQQAKHILLGL